MLVYAAGLWTDDDQPKGVLYLEFDWDRHIGVLLQEHAAFAGASDDATLIDIVNRKDRLVATNGEGRFGDRDTAEDPASESGGPVRVSVTATPHHGFDGLGLVVAASRRLERRRATLID